MITFIVSSEEEKSELLEASRHIHDLRDVDSDIPMVNTLMHLHLAHHLVHVDSASKAEVELSEEDIAKLITENTAQRINISTYEYKYMQELVRAGIEKHKELNPS